MSPYLRTVKTASGARAVQIVYSSRRGSRDIEHIGSAHEKSFRMAKSDLQARPVYHHLRDSIEAHLTVVFAALAVSRWIETRTGWSIRKFVRTARRYKTIQIQAGAHVITAADPLPTDLHEALSRIHRDPGAH